MRRVEAIIFDKDGTLFDFQATWGKVILSLLDRVAPGVLRTPSAEALGIDEATGRFRKDSVVIAGTTAEVALTLAAVTGRDAEEIAAIADGLATQAEQVPVVALRPCLEVLSARHALGLVTNDSEAPARAHLERAGIGDLFAFVAGYDSGHGAKPGPGQLLAFAAATGLDPARTLIVGDSRHDLAAGRAAGMGTVAVLTGIAEAHELRDLADAVLPDIGHLVAWIAAREAEPA